MAEGQAVSLKPSEMVAGGLLDEVNVRWLTSRFEMWDYNGKIATPVPAWKVEMEVEGESEKAAQYWSMGNSKDWVPSPDGKRLIAVGSTTTLKTSSNGAHLMASLVECGFPEDRIADDISVFENMVAFMGRKPAPKRAGLQQTPRVGPDGREYDNTILVVKDILKLPWEADKPAGAPGGRTATPTTKAAPPDKTAAETLGVAGGSLEEEAIEVVMAALAEKGTIQKKDLPTEAFQRKKDSPNRNAIVQMVFDDKFLAVGPWKFDNGVVSL